MLEKSILETNKNYSTFANNLEIRKSLEFIINELIIKAFAIYVYSPTNDYTDTAIKLSKKIDDIVEFILGGNRSPADIYKIFSKLIYKLTKISLELTKSPEAAQIKSGDLTAPVGKKPSKNLNTVISFCKAELENYRVMYKECGTNCKEPTSLQTLLTESVTDSEKVHTNDKKFLEDIVKNTEKNPDKLSSSDVSLIFSNPTKKSPKQSHQDLEDVLNLYGLLLQQSVDRLEMANNTADKLEFDDSIPMVTIEFYHKHLTDMISVVTRKESSGYKKYLLSIIFFYTFFEWLISKKISHLKYDRSPEDSYTNIYSYELRMFNLCLRPIVDQFIYHNNKIQTRIFAIMNDFKLPKSEDLLVETLLDGIKMLYYLRHYDEKTIEEVSSTPYENAVEQLRYLIRKFWKDTSDSERRTFMSKQVDIETLSNNRTVVSELNSDFEDFLKKIDIRSDPNTTYKSQNIPPIEISNDNKIKYKSCLVAYKNIQTDLVDKCEYDRINEIIEKCDKYSSQKVFDVDKTFNYAETNSISMINSYLMINYNLIYSAGLNILTFGGSGVGKTTLLFGQEGKNSLLAQLFDDVRKTYPFSSQNERAIILKSTIYEVIYDEENNSSCLSYVSTTKRHDETNINEINNIRLQPSNAFVTDRAWLIANFAFLPTEEFVKALHYIDDKLSGIRRKYGRIRPTINNPSSSRSALVYKFEFTWTNAINNKDKTSTISVVDLPGYELLKDEDSDFINDLVCGADAFSKNKDTDKAKQFAKDLNIDPNINCVSLLVMNNESGNRLKTDVIRATKNPYKDFEEFKSGIFSKLKLNRKQYLNTPILVKIHDRLISSQDKTDMSRHGTNYNKVVNFFYNIYSNVKTSLLVEALKLHKDQRAFFDIFYGNKQ